MIFPKKKAGRNEQQRDDSFNNGKHSYFFVVMVYLMSYAKIQELEAKVKVLDAMTRAIKASEEKRFSEKFKKGLADYVCDGEKEKK